MNASKGHACNLSVITPLPRCYGECLSRGPFFWCSHAESEKVRLSMFGFVMVLALVLVTVAPPFAVVARSKAKSRRR
jgi:hypothetical protein